MSGVVFSFMRANPPTFAHRMIVDYVKTESRKLGYNPFIFLSHSVDKRNPLSYESKIKIFQEYTDIIFNDVGKQFKNIFDVMRGFNKTYENVVIICGGDRVQKYTRELNRYNGVLYSFKSITILSIGERSADSISGTKMRQYASEDNFENFSKNFFTDDKKLQKEAFTEIQKKLFTLSW